jgi:hypothetical protein
MLTKVRKFLQSFRLRSKYNAFGSQLLEMKERAIERRSTVELKELKSQAEKIVHQYETSPTYPEYKLACWVCAECQSTIDAVESGSNPTYKKEFLQRLDIPVVHV